MNSMNNSIGFCLVSFLMERDDDSNNDGIRQFLVHLVDIFARSRES